MTCLVGIADAGQVWLGWDSRSTGSREFSAPLTPKGWRAGGYLVAGAGNGAWFAILRAVKWPAVASAAWPLELPRALLQAAQGLGLTLPNEEDDSATSGSALLAGAGCLWYFDSDLDVGQHREICAGSGEAVARGVLHVLRGRPRQRILKALEASAATVADVGPPFFCERA